MAVSLFSMFDYSLKKKKIKSKETILDQERFMYRDEIRPRTDASVIASSEDEARDEGLMVDYLKKPVPDNGVVSVIAACVGAACMAVAFFFMYRSAGKEMPVIGALAACSLIWSLAGMFFGIKGLFEKEKNYTASFVAIGIAALQIVFWVILMIVGGR